MSSSSEKLKEELGIDEEGEFRINPKSGEVEKKGALGVYSRTGTRVDPDSGNVQKKGGLGIYEDTDVRIDPESGKVQEKGGLGLYNNTNSRVDPESGEIQEGGPFATWNSGKERIDPESGQYQRKGVFSWWSAKKRSSEDNSDVGKTGQEQTSASRKRKHAISGGYSGSAGSGSSDNVNLFVGIVILILSGYLISFGGAVVLGVQEAFKRVDTQVSAANEIKEVVGEMIKTPIAIDFEQRSTVPVDAVDKDLGTERSSQEDRKKGEEPASFSGNNSTYVVEEGDTLWEIAEEHYGSGDEWPRIRDANKDVVGYMSDGSQKLIFPGQELVLP